MNNLFQFYKKWREYVHIDGLMYLTMLLVLALLYVFLW